MRTCKRILPAAFFLILGILAIAAPASAGSISTTLDLQVEELSFSRLDGFDCVDFRDSEFLTRPGSPMLPYRTLHFSLPAGYEVVSIDARVVESRKIDGKWSIYPAQVPVPMSHPEWFEFTPPDLAVYGSEAAFPGQFAKVAHQGNLSGYRIAAISLFPLQYIPKKGELHLVTRMEVDLELAPMAEPDQQVFVRSENAERIVRRQVLGMVSNPGDVPARAALHRPDQTRADTVDYLIVTDSAYVSLFQRLADWKTKKGVPTEVKSTSWVYSNYTGTDNQEKIRNCVKDYWQNKGLVFFLLGGDTGKVPYRKAFATGGNYGSDIPCDVYFCDLDNTWNDDGDSTWGELFPDNIDAYSDVYVARAPVDTTSQVDLFIDKVLQYEGHSSMPALPTDYQTRVLMLASWLDGSTNGAVLKDEIEYLWVPDFFTTIKLYESLGNLSPSSAVSEMNSGHNFINHTGHGSTGSIQAGTGYLNSSDMYNLTNAPRYGSFYSLSCFSASFDSNDCLAEQYCNAPGGGGFYVGNSRYGWYLPGMPHKPYSASWDKKFWKGIFKPEWDYWSLGQIHCAGKDNRIFVIWGNATECYCFYELNLFGDAEMPVFKDTPFELDVIHGATLPVGQSDFPIRVIADGTPVEGARVCLMMDSTIYLVGFTDSSGLAVFDVSPAATGVLDLTVTANNAIPLESTAQVDNGAAVPFIATVNPAIGPTCGGTAVTLSGYNFTSSPAMTASFEGTPASSTTFIDENTLDCITPAVGSYGMLDVSVSSSNGSNTFPNSFHGFLVGGPPYNMAPEDLSNLPVNTPFEIIVGGESSQTFFVYYSEGPGPYTTPYGTMGLDLPVYRVAAGTLNSDGYIYQTFTAPSTPYTFYLHAISVDNGSYTWAIGGDNPNGTGSIEVTVVE